MNKEELTIIIANILDKKVTDLDDLSGKDLFNDLGFDSISIMELISQIEERIGSLDDNRLVEAISSFDSMLELINNL